MDKTQKILTSFLWGILVLAMISIVGTGLWAKWRAQSSESPIQVVGPAQKGELPDLYDAPEFKLTDQEGHSFGSADLQGAPYIADFIYTTCPGPCLLMTSKLAEVAKSIPDKSVRQISFTVDPKRDTPQVLKEYSLRYHADPTRWHFLTGTEQEMAAVAAGMKIAAQRDESGQYTHSEKLLLVDGDGQVRGIYSMYDPDSLKQLAADAMKLRSAPARSGSGRP